MRSKCLILPLCLPFFALITQARTLRWQAAKMSTTTYDIVNTKATNSFLYEGNWRIVNSYTGAISSSMATPADYDTLQVFGASLTLSADFDMTALQFIVLEFGAPRSGLTYSLKVKRDNEWLLHNTAKVLVRSGDLVAEKDNFGCINTGIKIGGIYKLMAVDCAEAVVRAFTYASNITPETVSILQEGFVQFLLPVMLTDFDASSKNGQVVLTWQTQQETNSLHFVIERSTDAATFSPIAQVSAAGQSTVVKQYTYVDRQSFRGIAYYRIRSVSMDNTATWSVIRPVRPSADEQAIGIFPNPVRQYATVLLGKTNAVARQWQVFNTAGQLLLAGQWAGERAGSFSLDLSPYRNGLFVLVVYFNDGSRQQKTFSVLR